MKINIRLIYLYLFSFIGLLIVVIGTVRIVDLGIKVFVFKDADKYEYYAGPITTTPDGKTVEVDEEKEKARQEKESQRQRQRELSGAISMLIVGLPLYAYHWITIQKESKKES